MTPAPSRSLSHLFAPSRTLSHLLALVLASAALFAQGFDRREETSEIRTFRYSGNGMRTLAIRNISGSIRVAAAGINDVRMNIRRVATADDAEGLRQAAREVTLGTSDGGLDVAVVVSDVDVDSAGPRSCHFTGRLEDGRRSQWLVGVLVVTEERAGDRHLVARLATTAPQRVRRGRAPSRCPAAQRG